MQASRSPNPRPAPAQFLWSAVVPVAGSRGNATDRLVVAVLHYLAHNRVLVSLGLPSDPPVVAPARGPPEPQLPWE